MFTLLSANGGLEVPENREFDTVPSLSDFISRAICQSAKLVRILGYQMRMGQSLNNGQEGVDLFSMS